MAGVLALGGSRAPAEVVGARCTPPGQIPGPAARPASPTAIIGLLHERNLRRAEIVGEQLQAALNSRVVIEQAKGKLAERLGLDMDTAFATLRHYARDHNLRLSDLAQTFVDSDLADFPGLTPQARRRHSQ